jgi:hypothetical protein
MVAGRPGGVDAVRSCIAALGFCAVVAVTVATAAPASADDEVPVRRVLVLSLPAVTWLDVQGADVPNLDALFAQSAVADMTVAGPNDEPIAADGYVTISAGARALARPPSGDCAETEEGVWTCAAFDRIASHNDGLLFDAKAGLLGATLSDGGVSRSFRPPPPGGSTDAALALVDRSGVLAESAAERTVEVVEAGGLVGLATAAARRAALEAFDPTLPALLNGNDPARDAVVVVGPGTPPNRLSTTVAALRAPGLRPGLMKSAYTRRAATVAIVDVAPTILDQLGIERPREMEGRPFEFARTGGSYEDRLETLVEINARAQFRDRAITQAGGIFVGCALVLAGAAALWFAAGRTHNGIASALDFGALSLLLFLPATHAARAISIGDSGLRPYWWFVIGASLLGAALLTSISPRCSTTPVIVALSLIVGVIVIDVLRGAHLQFNGTFGYSPTIGGRYAGLGNLGYAQLAVGALFLACLLFEAVRGRAGLWVAGSLFVLAVLVDGLPYFGADVGGVLSMVPAFGLTFAMLCGWRFRWRLIAILGGLAAMLLALFAAIDLARPADDRSHLGRLLGGNGSDVSIVLRRKLQANLDVLTASPFALLLPLIYLAAAYYIWRSPGPLGVVRARMPAITAALAGVGTVALLGTALNDSGIAITGMMFGVTVSVLMMLCVRVGVRGDDAAPPAEPAVTEAVDT